MTSFSLDAPDSFVEVDGIRFAYRRFGAATGTPLVFLNRFRGTMDDWDPLLVDALAEERPVILFDNAGIGRSGGRTQGTVTEMAQAAAAFITAVARGPVDVIGFSLGGYVAQRLALGFPEVVRRVVLAGTGPGAGEGILPSKPQVGPLRSAPQMDLAALRVLFFTESGAGIRAGDGLWERTHRRANREPEVSPDSYGQQIEAIKHFSTGGDTAYPELGRLHHPVLVANGHDDVMVPTINSFSMAQRLPDAELVIYPDSGHGFLFQYAEMFAVRVNEFLDRADQGAPA
ncbi:alpha/beta hydrolase [Streptomyces sp. NBC_01571]|uniref:alpha/beta fold hydrolase n=1 Tax=Streptomyces sp. NBC_01571 TaxID=2975883 RepID=UPI00225600F8|nr:alpha/beta hydrolase [Streptomyces sp. NBC_01571]MCX4571862.1 alpha/beta hydrolase [Streptomyces sp. NBC_01571]